MKQETRAAIEVADQAARSADIPAYSQLVDLVLRAQSLLPHSSPARKKLVSDIVDAINLIHKEK